MSTPRPSRTARAGGRAPTVRAAVGRRTWATVGFLALLTSLIPAQASVAATGAGLCPSATPTATELREVFDDLAESMRDKAGRTGVATSMSAVDDSYRRSWSFHADPGRERFATSFRHSEYEDGVTFVHAQRGSYVDLRTHLSYRRISSDDPGTTVAGQDALRRLWKGVDPVEDEVETFLWRRSVRSEGATWPYPGYLTVMNAADEVTDVDDATFTCTATGTRSTVTATGPQESRRLTLTVDGDGAPVSFDLRDAGSADDGPAGTWWSGSVTYARPSLHRPLVSYNTTQYRRLVVGGAAVRFRDQVLTYVGPDVARAAGHARRVALLRKLSRGVSARFIDLYAKDPSVPLKVRAVTIRDGKKYTLAVGRKAVATLTFTVVGTTIRTRTRVPARPYGDALAFRWAGSVLGDGGSHQGASANTTHLE